MLCYIIAHLSDMFFPSQPTQNSFLQLSVVFTENKCIYVCACVCVCVCMYVYMCMDGGREGLCVYVNVCECVHACIHTYIHI